MVVAEFQESRVVKRKPGKATRGKPTKGGPQPKKQKTAAKPPPGPPRDEEDEEDGEEGGSETSSDSSYASSSSDEGADDSSSNGAGEEDSGSEDEEVKVDLEFFDPAEIDYRGLKVLLGGYLDGAEYAVHELVDLIIAQKTVGTVVKTAEDVDPLGLLTVLSLARHRQLPCLRQVLQFMREHCPDKRTKKLLQEAWDGPATGLLVSERLINCPPQLGPPLVQALLQEVAWATEDEPTQELRESFAFQQYLLLTKAFQEPPASSTAAQQPPLEGSGAEPKQGKRKKGAAGEKRKGGKAQATEAGLGLVYLRPEDEFFHRHAAWAFTFPAAAGVAREGALQPLRLVLALTPAQAVAARVELDSVVGNAAAGPLQG